jgi:hypothetical protein
MEGYPQKNQPEHFVKAKNLHIDALRGKLSNYNYNFETPIDIQIGVVNKNKYPVRDFEIHLPSGVSPRHIKDLAKFILSQKNNLESVVLNAEGSFRGDAGAVSLSPIYEALESVKHLKSLRVNVNSSNFNSHSEKHEPLAEIGKAVRKLSQLENLAVGVSSNNASNEALKVFFNGLVSLKRLESLSFNLSGSALINQQTFTAALSRLKEVTSLEDLKIYIAYNPEVDNQVINRLSSSLQYLEKLKSLDLDINCCGVTHEGLKYIADFTRHLSEFHSLEELTVTAIQIGFQNATRAHELFDWADAASEPSDTVSSLTDSAGERASSVDERIDFDDERSGSVRDRLDYNEEISVPEGEPPRFRAICHFAMGQQLPNSLRKL